MWVYEKSSIRLKSSTCNPMLAKFLIEQYGGADGELASSAPALKPALHDS